MLHGTIQVRNACVAKKGEYMARRMNGEGLLRKRPDGRWEVRVMDGRRDDGKPNYIYFYGRTKSIVSQKLKDFNEKLNGGIDLEHSYTFAEWSEVWFNRQKQKITPTTEDNYRYILRKLLTAEFSDMKIYAVKAIHIEDFLYGLRAENYSDSYIGSCRGMLFQIFHKAEANSFVRKNPVALAEKMKSTKPAKVKESFTSDEVRALMEKLPLDTVGLGIRLLIGTGMRTQELLGLQPCHIQEDGSIIHVRQAVALAGGKVTVATPKTLAGYRDIPVPKSLQGYAMALRKTDKEFIFEQRKKGVPCNPTYFRDKFREYISAIEGVRLLTPHCCRHTYVSQMQALGVDISTIKSIVGHTSEKMTEHYLHVQSEIKREAVQKFSDAFSQN